MLSRVLPKGSVGPKHLKRNAVSSQKAGNLVHGSGAEDAVQVSSGVYEVTFDQPVEGCAAVATIGLSGGLGVVNPDAFIHTNTGDPDFNSVQVSIRAGGAYTSESFHLAVFCSD